MADPEETGVPFDQLTPPRREWLVATGARYIWTDPQVLAARRRLYDNLRSDLADPHGRVVDRIAANIQVYVEAFHLGIRSPCYRPSRQDPHPRPNRAYASFPSFSQPAEAVPRATCA